MDNQDKGKGFLIILIIAIFIIIAVFIFSMFKHIVSRITSEDIYLGSNSSVINNQNLEKENKINNYIDNGNIKIA